MRTVCAERDVDSVEFNGEANHVHLLIGYPATLAISALCTGLKAAPPTPCAMN
jgi:putative transposase